RQLGENDDAVWRGPRTRVDLDAVRVAESLAVPQSSPCEEPRGVLSSDNKVRPAAESVVVPVQILHTDQRGLRLSLVAKTSDAVNRVRVPHDPVEEAVRREEREVTAEIAVGRDQVEHVRGRVLLVPGKDDQLVAPCQLGPGREGIE